MSPAPTPVISVFWVPPSFREIWILPAPIPRILGSRASQPAGQPGRAVHEAPVVVLWVSAYNAMEWFTSAPW